MKLLAGFLSGSVGLIADGADATVDTVSASLVWIGIKYKKEDFAGYNLRNIANINALLGHYS